MTPKLLRVSSKAGLSDSPESCGSTVALGPKSRTKSRRRKPNLQNSPTRLQIKRPAEEAMESTLGNARLSDSAPEVQKRASLNHAALLLVVLFFLWKLGNFDLVVFKPGFPQAPHSKDPSLAPETPTPHPPPPPRGREDYVQCAAARLQEQNGSLLHMNSFGAIPRVERNVLACPTLKEPASL